MRLVAVSIVKNEADIIESFVRHTRAWTDHHLIFDHDSTDGTRQILGALRAEGVPLTLFTDDALGNLQQLRSNHLTRLAVDVHHADWVLPLDADEILTGPGRESLEAALTAMAPGNPASLPLINYCPTPDDDISILNPILRLRYCQASPPRTTKVFIPAPLAREPGVTAGKGSHELYRGTTPIPDHPLPAGFHLSHLALRSPQHQALRVVLAELQKLSRGKAHEGLDVHYRLGFQLLAEDPELFFATATSAKASLKFQPIEYRGAPLNPALASTGWNRVARALLPFLEKLAASHGRLIDRSNHASKQTPEAEATIRELTAMEISPLESGKNPAPFHGFTAVSGWGQPEGPVPEAFLPAFHWGYAPVTHLNVDSDREHTARLAASGLTYSENQRVRVELNGVILLEHSFSRTNQKEKIDVFLPLKTGKNQLSFHYSQALVTDHDARKLAVIFLSLRVMDSPRV